MELKLNRGDWTYFIKFGGKDSCKLTQMAFDPYVFRKRQYIPVENWEMEAEQNYWKKAFQETPGYPDKTFHDFKFTTTELRITTQLQQKHVDGTVIEEALLRVFNQSEIPVLNIYFKNITLNRITREGKGGKRQLLTILFDYERIKMEYLNTPEAKGPGAKTIAEWNVKSNNKYYDDPVYETVEVIEEVPYVDPHSPLAMLKRESGGDDPFGLKKKEKDEKETKPFKIQLKEDNEPRTGIPYKVKASGVIIEDKTSDDGIIEVEIPKSCTEVNLLINSDEKIAFKLDEIKDEKKNKQVILSNLGLYFGKIDGDVGSKTEKAVVGFQKKFDLKVDADPGPKTTEELQAQSIA